MNVCVGLEKPKRASRRHKTKHPVTGLFAPSGALGTRREKIARVSPEKEVLLIG